MGGDFDAIVGAMLDRAAAGSRTLIGIDGIGASGKSTFAAAVARSVPDRPVLVLHLDDFFAPTRIRHRRGRHSAEGFWLDAYDYDALIAWALKPLHPGGDGRYRPGCYDRETGERATPDQLQAPADALVLVEGTFAHRAELASWWDFSVFLDIPFTLSAERMAGRNQLGGEDADALVRRYRDAQRLYFAAAEPWRQAGLVIDNRAPDTPWIIDPGQASAARSGTGPTSS